MASTAHQTTQLLNARVTYALSLYCTTLEALGPREAYDQACNLAGLSLSDRAALRNAVYKQQRR